MCFIHALNIFLCLFFLSRSSTRLWDKAACIQPARRWQCHRAICFASGGGREIWWLSDTHCHTLFHITPVHQSLMCLTVSRVIFYLEQSQADRWRHTCTPGTALFIQTLVVLDWSVLYLCSVGRPMWLCERWTEQNIHYRHHNRHSHRSHLHHLLCALPRLQLPRQVSTNMTCKAITATNGTNGNNSAVIVVEG